MGFPPELAVATRNPGKIREILAICSGWPVEWITAESRPEGWPAVEETGQTYLENALVKAKAISAWLVIPAISDDSGIEVDALHGAPGVRSARFAGEAATDEENLRKLIASIAPVPPSDRAARYRCVAVATWPGGPGLSAEGTCEGRLITEPRGFGGFGYDPIFLPEGYDRTMAELEPEEKDSISHRGKAFRALGRLLEGNR